MGINSTHYFNNKVKMNALISSYYETESESVRTGRSDAVLC